MSKKILVTGGGGFIGSHLARYLYQQGNHVRIADIKFDNYIKERYYNEKIVLDLREKENCPVATKGMDEVYNFAANMGGIGYITTVGADVMRDNVLINTHMLEAARKNSVKKYLFSSSACVYANYKQTIPNAPPLKESDAIPADPNEYYGWEKLFTEMMMEAYKRDYGLNVRIARFHNVYGPEGTYEGGKEKAPAALCRKVAIAKDGSSIIIWGDGKQTRSFLYIDDCVRALVLLMQSTFDGPINIGSDRLVTIDELAQIIIKISGKHLTIEHDLTKPQGVRGRNADLSLVSKVIGWKPVVPLEQGLERTYRWIEKKVLEDRNSKY